MLNNKNDLRKYEGYLWEQYGIMYAPYCNEAYPWWIPDVAAETTMDYEYLVDYVPVKTSLKVNPGDYIAVSLFKETKDATFLMMENIHTEERVYLKYKYRCYYDDDRYELIMKLASGLKDIPNVIVQFCLLQTDEFVLRYIEN